MSGRDVERERVERQKRAINLLRDYLLTLISTQAVGLILLLLWLRTNPPKPVIFAVFFMAALILAIFWPAALSFLLPRLKRRVRRG